MIKNKIPCLSAQAGRFFLAAALILTLAYTACEQPTDPPNQPATAAAALSDLVIDGTAGTEIESRDLTITITGATLNSPIAENTLLTSWVANLPPGLSARAKSAFPEGADQVILVIAGTPESASYEAVALTIPGAFLSGSAALTAQENANARFAIAPAAIPDATVANITISGETGSPISEKEVVVTLNVDTLKEAITADTLLTWIANLPNGLSQAVKEDTEAGADTVSIRVYGTPQETKSEALAITIPAAFLTNDSPITVTPNEDARVEIIDSAVTRTATVADVLIRGAKNLSEPLGSITWVRDVAIEPQDVVITIINDTLKDAITQGQDLSGWIRNLPSGLEAKAKDPADAGSASITITVSGKPTSARSASLAVRIPADALTNSAAGYITAAANSDARFYVVDVLAELPRVPSDSLPNGVARAAGTTVLGTKGSPIASVDAVIALTNDTFVTESIATTGPANWITNLPAGLQQAIKSVSAATATITISGTPTVGGIAKIMEITIPGSALACGVPVQVVPEITAKYAIAETAMTTAEARTMIPITGGTVAVQPTWVYGSGQSSTGYSREAGPFAQTWLPVAVPDFKIGKYPVTEELWYEVYMWARAQGGGTEYYFGSYLIYTEPIPDQVKFFPKYRVSPREALIWCNAYSIKNGEPPAYYNRRAVTKEDGGIELNAAGIIKKYEQTGSGMDDIYVDRDHGYRLPVPSEWQYAARGGVINGTEWNYRWPGTNTLAEVKDYGWINELGIYSADHNMIPVGILKPNAAGLHDLIGAVREWMGRMDTADPSRCMTMGGQYNSDALDCAFDAVHEDRSWDAGRNYLGFRLAHPPDSSP
jgi:formylglycine-generating enzyme required for sulfatase activity